MTQSQKLVKIGARKQKKVDKMRNLNLDLIEVIISTEAFARLKKDNEQMIFVAYIGNCEYTHNAVILKKGRLAYINEKMISSDEWVETSSKELLENNANFVAKVRG